LHVKFLQTADPEKYARLLEVSARSTRAFCAIHGHQYDAFVGLKRGRYPWHATFNRIDLLNDAPWMKVSTAGSSTSTRIRSSSISNSI
jgi:hypothetical protein